MKSVKCDKGGDVGAAHQRSTRERNFFSLSGHCLFKVRPPSVFSSCSAKETENRNSRSFSGEYLTCKRSNVCFSFFFFFFLFRFNEQVGLFFILRPFIKSFCSKDLDTRSRRDVSTTREIVITKVCYLFFFNELHI